MPLMEDTYCNFILWRMPLCHLEGFPAEGNNIVVKPSAGAFDSPSRDLSLFIAAEGIHPKIAI